MTLAHAAEQISPEAAKADLAHLVELLPAAHPDPFTRISKADFDELAAEIEGRLDHPMTDDELWMELAPLVAAIEDGHTHLDLSIDDDTPAIPLWVRAQGGELTVIGTWRSLDAPESGSKIVSMDGRPASEIYDDLLVFCSGEMTSWRESILTSTFRYFYGVRYGVDKEVELVTVDADGQEHSWKLRQPEEEADDGDDEPAKGYLGVQFDADDDGVLLVVVSRNTPAEAAGLKRKDRIKAVNGTDVADVSAAMDALSDVHVGDEVELDVVRDSESLSLTITAGERPEPYNYEYMQLSDDVGYIDFRSFADKGAFGAFVESALTDMADNGVGALVVDVRNNGGGNSDLIEVFGQFVADDPFLVYSRMEVRASPLIVDFYKGRSRWMVKRLRASMDEGLYVNKLGPDALRPREPRFDGPLIVLTSERTFSSAADFAAVVKDYKWGVIVGEETGGLATSFGDNYPFELGNSKLHGTISHKRFVRPSGKDDGHGVFPDIPTPDEEAVEVAEKLAESLLREDSPPPDTDTIRKTWNFGDPAGTEEAFRALLLEFDPVAHREPALYILTQIARTQGLQKKFSDAFATLEMIDNQLTDDDGMLLVRAKLERGRALNSSGSPADARPHFERAFEIAVDEKLDGLAVDAAHMVAIVADKADAAVWTEKAIALVEASEDKSVKGWLGPLHNNMAWSLHDAGQFEESLGHFEAALAANREKGSPRSVQIARWSVARAWRSLERYDEALEEQLALDAEISDPPDGFVFEEIAECLVALKREKEAGPWFAKAWTALQSQDWIADAEPERWERLKKLGQP